MSRHHTPDHPPSDPAEAISTERAQTPAGDVGTSAVDVVPGDPPVPVTVWRVPASHAGRVYERIVTRVLAAYTRRGQVVFDAGCDPTLARVATAAGRRLESRTTSDGSGCLGDEAALAVAEWPLLRAGLDPAIVLGGLRRRLRPGGCLAVVVASAPPGEPPTELGPLVIAARAAGLTYLQHIIAVHANADGDTLTPQPAPDPKAATRARRGGAAHLRIHTDVLVFTRPDGHHG